MLTVNGTVHLSASDLVVDREAARGTANCQSELAERNREAGLAMLLSNSS